MLKLGSEQGGGNLAGSGKAPRFSKSWYLPLVLKYGMHGSFGGGWGGLYNFGYLPSLLLAVCGILVFTE